MKRIHNEKGFTLIELMATLAILALLVLIAVPAVGSIINNAGDSAEASSIKMIENAGALASIDRLDYDGSVTGEGYEVATLIDEGYLDFDLSDDLVSGYVVREGAGNNFVYNGDGSVSDDDDDDGSNGPPEVIVPEDFETPEPDYDSLTPTSGEFLDFTLNPNGDGYILTHFDNERADAPVNIVIPRDYNGMPVTHIGRFDVASGIFNAPFQAFDYSGDVAIESVVIPDTVTSIAENAFMGNNLKHVYIPDSVVYIGHTAFDRNALESFRLSRGLNTIEQTVFRNNNLGSIYLPDTITEVSTSAFDGNPNLDYVSVGADTILRGSDNTLYHRR